MSIFKGVDTIFKVWELLIMCMHLHNVMIHHVYINNSDVMTNNIDWNRCTYWVTTAVDVPSIKFLHKRVASILS